MGKQDTEGIDPYVETVREALNRTRGDWPVLAEKLREQNSRFSYRWLLAFASRQIADPSFTRVRLLGTHLGVKLPHEDTQ